MQNTKIKKLVGSALCMAFCIILPFFTAGTSLGSVLLPMHFPVFICAYLFGIWYGMAVGFISPLLRSIMFGMPVMFPSAIAMSIELCTYALIVGVFDKIFPKKKIFVYLSLIIAMIAGRLIWGSVMGVLASFTSIEFGFQIFIVATLLKAFPGMILQIVLIPLIIIRIRQNEYKNQIYVNNG